MKEITIVFTAQFTEIIKDPAEMEFIMNNTPDDLRKLQEQTMRDSTNYDNIRVSSFKVFPHEVANG